MAAHTLQRSVSLQTTSRATLLSCASRFHSATTLCETDKSQSNLPAQIDLLDRYRGLVTLGRIQEDEEQIRVIMQVCVSYLPFQAQAEKWYANVMFRDSYEGYTRNSRDMLPQQY